MYRLQIYTILILVHNLLELHNSIWLKTTGSLQRWQRLDVPVDVVVAVLLDQADNPPLEEQLGVGVPWLASLEM